MADTGWKSPTATGEKYNDWTNPTNAYSSDDAYATATDASPAKHQSYESFNFGIPSEAIISGVIVSVEGLSSGAVGGVYLKYWSESDDAWSDYKDVFWGSSTSTQSEGSDSDLWGRTPVDTDFSDANFSVEVYTTADEYGFTQSLDHIKVKIYYIGRTTGPLPMFKRQ